MAYANGYALESGETDTADRLPVFEPSKGIVSLGTV
jgi:hypothetical protein